MSDRAVAKFQRCLDGDGLFRELFEGVGDVLLWQAEDTVATFILRELHLCLHTDFTIGSHDDKRGVLYFEHEVREDGQRVLLVDDFREGFDVLFKCFL